MAIGKHPLLIEALGKVIGKAGSLNSDQLLLVPHQKLPYRLKTLLLRCGHRCLIVKGCANIAQLYPLLVPPSLEQSGDQIAQIM
ncbi:hypothetical protein D3C79_836230 [compost metagenome]